MNTKFKFTGETKVEYGVTLRRIGALKDFGNVSKGDKGGWIEREENISGSGNAWVYGNAQVCGNARVYGDAWVYGEIKLEAGLFFGVKWSSDTEIKQVEIENGNYLVYKGEAKFGTDEPETDDATENAIKLFKENVYRIIKD